MTYSDDYNIRTTQVKFNDVAEAIDGVLTRNNGGTTAGSSTSYTASPLPAWSSVETGAFIIVIPHTSNGVDATLNVSDTGAAPILQSGQPVQAGKFVANVPQLLLYNGIGWEIVAGGAIQPTLLLPLTLDASNNRVGINSTTPETTLHLKSASPIIRIEDTDGGIVDLSGDGASGSLSIKADAANARANTIISFEIDGSERAAISGSGAVTCNNVSATTGQGAVSPLVGRGAAGQTANLLELKNSGGVNQFSVGPTGAVTGATSASFSGGLSAASGTFSGAVSGTTGTFTGAVSGTTGSFTTSVTTPTLVGKYNALTANYEITSTAALYLHNASSTAYFSADLIETPSIYGAGAGTLVVASELGNLFLNADLYVDITSATRDIRFYCDATRDVRFPSIVTGTGTTAVIEGSTNAIKKSSSSRRYKKDIEPLEAQYSNNIFALQPKWFRLNVPQKVYPDSWGYFGLIAEEVAEIDPRLVVWSHLPEDLDENDDIKPGAQMVPESVNYQILPVLMIDIIKQLRAEVDALKAKVG